MEVKKEGIEFLTPQNCNFIFSKDACAPKNVSSLIKNIFWIFFSYFRILFSSSHLRDVEDVERESESVSHTVVSNYL